MASARNLRLAQSRDHLAQMLDYLIMNGVRESGLKKHRQSIGGARSKSDEFSTGAHSIHIPFIRYRGEKKHLFTFTLHLLGSGSGVH